MSYNVTAIDIVSGELRITEAASAAVLARAGDDLCETMSDYRGWRRFYVRPDDTVRRIPFGGEWSGRCVPALIDFLSACTGSADVVLYWEGGDSLTGYKVADGVVTPAEVVLTVVIQALAEVLP